MPANRPTPLARDPHHITCLECRAAKRKCHRPNTDTSCQRCTKFGLHCEYRPHHRGRRRDKVLATSTTVEPEPDTEPETNVTPTKPIARRDIAFSHVVPIEGDSYPYVSQQPTPPHPILRPESPAPSSEHVLLERLLTSPSPDPLDAGLLTLDQAQSLFRVYFDHLNYAVPLLDPVLCTPDSCRERSPLLFTAVITVTAKSARPRVYRSCLLLANRLVGKAVESNNSNLETVQALYLLAHFKEPHDTSAWKRVGYAIRMALELRLNVMASRPLRDDQSGREAIARERTWLNLLVSDYHLAIHHTLPRMITDDSIDDPQAWLDSHPVSLTQPADKALPALIEFSRMCRLYADLLAAMNGDPANLTLLAWLERRWNQWRKTWGPNQGLAPLQVAVLRLCDAFFGFHIYEYKLLFTARYREESSSRIPSQLELAFVQCVEAAIGPPRVFLAEFVSHGFLPYSPNILWVALAVTGVWLIRNVKSMDKGCSKRAMETLVLVSSSCAEASQSSADLPAYMSRLLKHLLNGSEGYSAPPSPVSKSPSGPAHNSTWNHQQNTQTAENGWTIPNPMPAMAPLEDAALVFPEADDDFWKHFLPSFDVALGPV